jgi:hypothetical protein
VAIESGFARSMAILLLAPAVQRLQRQLLACGRLANAPAGSPPIQSIKSATDGISIAEPNSFSTASTMSGHWTTKSHLEASDHKQPDTSMTMTAMRLIAPNGTKSFSICSISLAD